MSVLPQAARGASRFADPDSYPTRPLDPSGLSVSAEQSASSWDELADDLLRLRSLGNDWDGQGAAAPHLSLVVAALRLLLSLRARPDMAVPDRVLAGVDGTIVFEWHTPLTHEEIEVVAPTIAEYRREDMTSPAMPTVLLQIPPG